MKKIDLSGGVSSVVAFPTPMKNGGDLSVPPPKSAMPPRPVSTPPVYLADGGNDGNNEELMPRFDQFTEEEKKILEEEMLRNYFFDLMNNEALRQMFQEIEEDPYHKQEMERYRRMEQGIPEVRQAANGGIANLNNPNLSQQNNLQPAGILSINKIYDI